MKPAEKPIVGKRFEKFKKRNMVITWALDLSQSTQSTQRKIKKLCDLCGLCEIT